MTRVLLLMTLVALLAAHRTSSAAARFHPDLQKAVAELDRARGPEAYAALRRVWDTWDRADPQQVEEALVLASRSARLEPSARAYAATLSAYARLRRGDLKAARDELRRLGYVDHWLVVGPFDNEGKAGLLANQGPELDLRSALSTLKAYTGKERPVRWRAVPDAFPYAFLDFGALVRPESKVCALAATFVTGEASEKAPRKLSAWVGSGGAFRLFWNAREAHSFDTYSRHDFERISVPLTLEPGPNLLVVKACGDEQAPTLSVRFATADGSPAEKLTFSADVANAEAAAATALRLAKTDAGKAAKGKAAPAKSATTKTDGCGSVVGQDGRIWLRGVVGQDGRIWA